MRANKWTNGPRGPWTRWTGRGPLVSDYVEARAPSGTSTRPRKSSRAASGPLSIRVRVCAFAFFPLHKDWPHFPRFLPLSLVLLHFSRVGRFLTWDTSRSRCRNYGEFRQDSVVNSWIVLKCRKRILGIKLSKSYHRLIVRRSVSKIRLFTCIFNAI